jgi:hypothetical protein
MRKQLATVVGVLCFAIPLAGAPEASADDTICTGSLGAITVDDLVVPDGATCTLNGTQVDGNVVVKTGATLRAQYIDVNGNIDADGHHAVIVTNYSTVGGSIQVRRGNRAVIYRVQVNGNVQVEQNTGRIWLTRNDVGNNMQVNQKTGGVRIANNVIAQTLQCQANDPAPTGGGNIAGDKTDQCETL